MILIVVNNAWYAYNFRLNLARSFKNNGYIVCFAAPYDDKYTKLIQKEFECYNISMDAKGINPINDLKTMITLYQLYKKIEPQIVLNFTIKPNIYSSLVCGILKIKCISNITGLGTIFIKESFVTKLAKLMYKRALSYNEKVFFQNNDDKDLFLTNQLIQKSKIDLVPGSGVDLNKFSPVVKETKNKKLIFLMVARLLKDKGVVELVEAIKLLKQKYDNFEVHLLGALGVANHTAITKEELESWIELDLVKYLGITDSVQDVLLKADCVVLPSYREGTPRSLLEAAAMAKPIITTNTVGCKEVVENNINGYLCKVKDSNDLALKMEKMLSLSKTQLEKMGLAGRNKIINEFDEKFVINKYINVINELLK